MKTKKFLCSICLIFFVSGLFIILGTENTEEPIIYEYEVMASTSSIKSILGSYTIQAFPKNKKVIEKKDYNLVLMNEPVNICNTKVYTYDPQFRLIQYEENETYNTEDKYSKSALVNYDLEKDRVCINFSEPSSENRTIFLDKDIPYTINSSFVLSLILGYIPDDNETWSCYEGKGFIDNYSCHENELINPSAYNQAEYKTIQQIGLFETTYWFNQKGILTRIEQQMDEDYTVIFILKD